MSYDQLKKQSRVKRNASIISLFCTPLIPIIGQLIFISSVKIDFLVMSSAMYSFTVGITSSQNKRYDNTNMGIYIGCLNTLFYGAIHQSNEVSAFSQGEGGMIMIASIISTLSIIGIFFAHVVELHRIYRFEVSSFEKLKQKQSHPQEDLEVENKGKTGEIQ